MNSTQSPNSRQGANSIAEDLERRIREGELDEGERLPSIRGLAEELDVSPATVSAAYGRLRSRGLIVASRRGTVVAPTPELPVRSSAPSEDVSGRDVSDGNPDPRLLPDLGSIDMGDGAPLLYGATQDLEELTDVGRRLFEEDSVPADNLAIVGGSHDGVERALSAHLLPGDRVAVEDPGYSGTHDLVRAMGLVMQPVSIDDRGMRPSSLESVLSGGVSAVILTNRAQNAMGSAMDSERAAELSDLVDSHPDCLVIEDDHAGPVSGAPFHTTIGSVRARWIVVRSFGKYLAPDLRVGVMAGDALTVSRVRSKQLVGTGWVSRLLQRLVVRGLTDEGCIAMLHRAEGSYTERRNALREALSSHGIEISAASGFNVWVPVEKETEAWGSLLRSGWVVAPGEDFRIESPPGIRITVSSLEVGDMEELAAAVAAAITSRTRV